VPQSVVLESLRTAPPYEGAVDGSWSTVALVCSVALTGSPLWRVHPAALVGAPRILVGM